MSHLRVISEDDATGATADLYDDDRAAQGYVANYTKAFSARPAVYTAWRQLNAAIKSGMDLRRYEVATLAAARELRSTYCAVAHGVLLADQHLGADAVHALVEDSPGREPDPLDAAITRLATKITHSAADVGPADYDELRALGLADDEILDIVLAVAARCFFSTVLEATGTQADAIYRSTVPDALRAALTVGRPVAEA